MWGNDVMLMKHAAAAQNPDTTIAIHDFLFLPLIEVHTAEMVAPSESTALTMLTSTRNTAFGGITSGYTLLTISQMW